MKRLGPGLIAISMAFAAGIARAAGDPNRGATLYDECRACHAIEHGASGIGPGLHGVFGRRAGGLEEFRYSPALKRSGITWSPQTMDAYIADPQKVVPANRMPYAGMPDPRDRSDLIEYMLRAFR